MKQQYIGDKVFYQKLFMLALPILFQNVITNVVSLIDNIMVGGLGTDNLTAAAIGNQLLFIYNASVTGLLSGAGIYTAQYYGEGNRKGVGATFKGKVILATLLTALALFVLFFFKKPLIEMFLHQGSSTGSLKDTFIYAEQYMSIMLFTIVPFCISQVLAGTLREMSEVTYPMIASLLAVAMNTALNYLLIYGKFGAPKLGIIGAGLATMVARLLECSLILILVVRRSNRFYFIKDFRRKMQMPSYLLKGMVGKGTALMISSFIWSGGVTFLAQSFATRGLAAIAAYNIASTVNNIFANVFGALSMALLIIVGQLLGAGKVEEAKSTDKKVMAFSFMVCIVIGGVMAIAAPFIPNLYNTSTEVKRIATGIILIMASILPWCAVTNGSGSTLQAGGKTKQSLLFNGGYTVFVVIPVAFVLSRYTNMTILPLFFICQYLELIKAIFFLILIRKGDWAQKVIK